VLTFTYRQVQYLAQLVEDIDLMTAADYGDLSLNTEPAQVFSLIEDECNIFKANYSLDFEIQGDDLVLELDALRFRQIIKNLLQNALTARPDNLLISIALYRYDDHVELTLEDNGPGVHEDELGKIFERLYRVDSSRNNKTGGSGLGLSIVRQLVGLHGGTITAYLPKTGGLGLRMVFQR
jgi:signal transduction histidine kinase